MEDAPAAEVSPSPSPSPSPAQETWLQRANRQLDRAWEAVGSAERIVKQARESEEEAIKAHDKARREVWGALITPLWPKVEALIQKGMVYDSIEEGSEDSLKLKAEIKGLKANLVAELNVVTENRFEFGLWEFELYRYIECRGHRSRWDDSFTFPFPCE